MNEDLVRNVLVNAACNLDDVSQPDARGLVLLLLGINHIDYRTALFNGGNVVGVSLLELLVAWEVFNCKLDERVVVNLCKTWWLIRRHYPYSGPQLSLSRQGRRFRGVTSSRRLLSEC